MFERFDEEVVVIHLGTGAYHSITGSGKDAFPLLTSAPSAAELVVALAAKYDAPPATLAADINGWLDLLRKESIIVPTTEARATPPPALEHSGPRIPYVPPALQPFHDLQELFLMDPVHDVGAVGWPAAKPADTDVQLRYKHASPAQAIFERFEAETVVINLSTGVYRGLTGSAEDIFLLLDREPSVDEIVNALAAKYQATHEELTRGAILFLDVLVSAGFAECAAANDSPVRLLALAKPGSGLLFVSPSFDSLTDRFPAPSLLEGPDGRKEVDYFQQRFQVPGHVIVRITGSEALVIKAGGGVYYSFNSSATAALRVLQQGPTAAEFLDALGRRFDVTRSLLTARGLLFLHNMCREGLLEIDQAKRDPRRLDAGDGAGNQPFEPFSMQIHRDLKDVFLPFKGTMKQAQASSGGGRELAAGLARYFGEAAGRSRVTGASFLVAGQTLCVRCAGSTKADELTLAFDHLRTNAPPNLTLYYWDAASGGPTSQSLLSYFMETLYSKWQDNCGPRGEVLAFHSRELPVLYHAGPDLLSVVDLENQAAYVLKRDDSPLPYWEIGSPFRGVLHYWLSRRGLQFVHGGAVGGATGGVIIAGKGGAGKSTTSLACLNAGMFYAGDDYCAIAPADGAQPPYLHSLYSTGKLKGDADLDRFPVLREHLWDPGYLGRGNGVKATFSLCKLWPERLRAGFPLRAVLAPRITGGNDTRLADCSESQALLALAASTIAQLPMAGAEDLDRLGDLVAGLPCYTIELGTDLSQIPKVIQSIL